MADCNSTILQTATCNFEQTAERLKLAQSITRKFLDPKERIEITINPVLPDSSMMIHIKVFVVRHNDTLGPSKGGIRMAPDLSLDDIAGLAMEMTWKTSLIGVPFGGGKAGISYDPRMLSPKAKEIVIRSFVRGTRRYIGPELYIPAPDMGTNETDMGHIRDCIAYSSGTSITNGCFVTGKPVILGGILGRREATGRGVVHTIVAMCEKLGWDIANTRVAVQGFGNVGSTAAVEIVKYGAKVVAVSDISGGIINHQGLDVKLLLEYMGKTNGVKGFKGAMNVTREAILEVDCDILIPAATQSQIITENADRIQARVVAEGANAPTTPGADEILKERGIQVIPDILCNAGGVFVSYLEYTQETQREQMTLSEVEWRLSERMREKFNEVHDYAKNEGIEMRKAALDIAVKKVVNGTYARGLLP